MAKSEPVDYRSVTKVDFHKDVVRLSPRPEPMVGLLKMSQELLSQRIILQIMKSLKVIVDFIDVLLSDE
ncbi:hypothetical protein Smp_170600 [Schistosoma mansoni]|uniref:hypothetical protein n=1 Tax=Schistosoma mansoni TaxID=6183 RepID=UPI0001A62E76|nr:hypothetical protein Smp_170600 [Schistosoma mansoni]|eukprot:XP_018649370.1 hypothetical protein Smp_170600 [Schistosoma mansoni]